MKNKNLKVLGLMLIIFVGFAIGYVTADPPTYDYNQERNPLWQGISDVNRTAELDIIDLDLCGITSNIIEINTNISHVNNYTTYEFVNNNGTIIREFSFINQSAYKIPLFINRTLYWGNLNLTFSDLGFGEINNTEVPFYAEDYYRYYTTNDEILNITYAYIQRSINDNNMIFNETSIIVSNNKLTITKAGWYKILYNPFSSFLNLSLNNISSLIDSTYFPLTNPSIVYLEENDFITSRYYVNSTYGNYPSVYMSYNSGVNELTNVNNTCSRLALEYVGT